MDKVLTDFGFPMGPFAMGDLAGLDVGWRIRKGKGVKSAVADRICELGRFGQKTGAGYFRYEKGDRTPIPDADVEKIIVEVASEMGITRRKIGDDEILARLLYPMVNEGAKILEEKIAIRASDIDVIWVYGYGWPVYRGGPMFWADQVGLKAMRDRMQRVAEDAGRGLEAGPAAGPARHRRQDVHGGVRPCAPWSRERRAGSAGPPACGWRATRRRRGARRRSRRWTSAPRPRSTRW